MVELRKRKAPAAATPPPAKKAHSVKSSTSSDTIALEGFGGEIETNDGNTITLKQLVDDSKSGVVLFTYPKASTPGCTTQACGFRDEFTPLTATGLSIYGLSTDSPKANTNFKTKQRLPYLLLCDPKASLIAAIGMKKAPSGTTRGVFVVFKDGRVAAVASGGPAATVEMVRNLVAGGTPSVSQGVKTSKGVEEVEKAAEVAKDVAQRMEQPKTSTGGDAAKADVAAEVADSARKLDSEAQP